MAYRLLEVTLISAKDLKKVTVFSKMRIYAVASISGGGPRLPTHRTNADHDGGRSPAWNAPLYFPVPVAADPRGLALHVLLRSERVFGDRDVGEVFVPLEDLLAGAPADGEAKSVSYQVRRPMSGRAKGVLHISYRFSAIPADATAAAGFQEATKGAAAYPNAHASPKPTAGSAHPVTAYPAPPPAGYPPQHAAAYPHAVPYGAPYHAGYAQQPYGYPAMGPTYGYGAPPTAYGYGAPPQAAPAARKGGMGMGLGMGLLGGAVGGMLLGDMIADAEVDAAYDAGFDDGLGF